LHTVCVADRAMNRALRSFYLLLICLFCVNGAWAKATVQKKPGKSRQQVVEAAAPAAVPTVGLTQRTTSLADLGLTEPIVLGGVQTTRTVYFPVPSKTPISDIQWEIPYHVAGVRKGGAALTVYVNERLVLREELAVQSKGVLRGTLEKAGASGFLRIRTELEGAGLSGRGTDNVCEAPATVVLDPSMQIRFQYRPESMVSVGDVWSLLPTQPLVLLPPKPLPPITYQTAFRVGAAFAKIEKHAEFESLPAVGQTVDTTVLDVPNGWQDIPAFRALSKKDRHVLGDRSELTAWVVFRLQRKPLPSVLVVDAAMLQDLQQGLDALVAQVQGVRGGKGQFINEWMAAQLSQILQVRSDQRVLLQPTESGGVLVVGPNASVAFGQMVEPKWQLLMRTSGSSWGLQSNPTESAAELRFRDIGLPIGPVTATDRLEWGARFDLGQSALSGRVPSEVVMDLVLPDMRQDANPLAKLYFNDMLLTGGVLSFDKQGVHRLRARIPASAVQVDNGLTLIVEFAQSKNDCVPVPVTVGIQPTSHFTLTTAKLGKNFNGHGHALSKGGHVLVPDQYLRDPQRSLRHLIWMSRALALNTGQVSVGMLPRTDVSDWPKPFMAWEAPPSVIDALSNGKVPQPASEAWDGLANGLAVRVMPVAGETSTFVRVQGTGLDDRATFGRFRHGSVALVESNGRLLEWDDTGLTREAHLDELRQPWVLRNIGWWLPAALVLGFVGMLVVASHIRRGKR